MIEISTQKAYIDGSCQACNSNMGRSGLINSEEKIFVISISKGHSGSSFRLCQKCYDELNKTILIQKMMEDSTFIDAR